MDAAPYKLSAFSLLGGQYDLYCKGIGWILKETYDEFLHTTTFFEFLKRLVKMYPNIKLLKGSAYLT